MKRYMMLNPTHPARVLANASNPISDSSLAARTVVCDLSLSSSSLTPLPRTQLNHKSLMGALRWASRSLSLTISFMSDSTPPVCRDRKRRQLLFADHTSSVHCCRQLHSLHSRERLRRLHPTCVETRDVNKEMRSKVRREIKGTGRLRGPVTTP